MIYFFYFICFVIFLLFFRVVCQLWKITGAIVVFPTLLLAIIIIMIGCMIDAEQPNSTAILSKKQGWLVVEGLLNNYVKRLTGGKRVGRLVDPWGTEIRIKYYEINCQPLSEYRYPAVFDEPEFRRENVTRIRFVSAGPDCKFGTDDDIEFGKRVNFSQVVGDVKEGGRKVGRVIYLERHK